MSVIPPLIVGLVAFALAVALGELIDRLLAVALGRRRR
jgi:Ca2+/Na+ antiporter